MAGNEDMRKASQAKKDEFYTQRMQGDHIIAWSNGGTTVIENCQMLCAQCNGTKSNH